MRGVYFCYLFACVCVCGYLRADVNRLIPENQSVIYLPSICEESN